MNLNVFQTTTTPPAPTEAANHQAAITQALAATLKHSQLFSSSRGYSQALQAAQKIMPHATGMEPSAPPVPTDLGQTQPVSHPFVFRPLSIVYNLGRKAVSNYLSLAPKAYRDVVGGPRIAVIGAGLTGVTAAAYLLGYGFNVVIFEQSPKANMGGIWTRSIGLDRLREQLADESLRPPPMMPPPESRGHVELIGPGETRELATRVGSRAWRALRGTTDAPPRAPPSSPIICGYKHEITHEKATQVSLGLFQGLSVTRGERQQQLNPQQGGTVMGSQAFGGVGCAMLQPYSDMNASAPTGVAVAAECQQQVCERQQEDTVTFHAWSVGNSEGMFCISFS
ncbi:hypothetical protein GGTG_03386 [Gaeumannomyces tritici R3-111a-1]|uniref:FAD dependent oxidoreductase domain-containing protein n=1 Tax=Gaeumannomyces tritici (strain R3-111a-1) TaxID=644352 RepID=J3NQ29_GAET3|nr:hypothetical protein GGTG_03386 [Gaeumannomyces tritici R3-111a-1]EJT78285.1 hypothetical protein GGTG_03386 [Gaeumannomyces tritici R3-111a-1]